MAGSGSGSSAGGTAGIAACGSGNSTGAMTGTSGVGAGGMVDTGGSRSLVVMYSSLPPASLSCRRRFLRMVEFHRFLIALSVRPGMSLTILDHFVP